MKTNDKTNDNKLDINLLLKQAKDNVKLGRYKHDKIFFKAAESIYTELINSNPTANLYYLRGVTNIDSAEYDKAHNDLTKSIELDPNNSRTYVALGVLNMKKLEPLRALLNLNEAICLDSKSNNAYRVRGYLYVEMNKPRLAISDLTKALELDPNDFMAYNNRGYAHLMNKDFSSSLGDFTQTVNLKPNNDDAYLNRAVALMKLNRFKEAEYDLNVAATLNSENKSLYCLRGDFLRLVGIKDMAKLNYQKTISLFAIIKEKTECDYCEAIRAESGIKKLGLRNNGLIKRMAIEKGILREQDVDYLLNL